MNPNLLTEDEVKGLLTSAVEAHGALLESDAIALLTWAENVRLKSTCLDLVVAGKLQIRWEDDEPHFSTVEVCS